MKITCSPIFIILHLQTKCRKCESLGWVLVSGWGPDPLPSFLIGDVTKTRISWTEYRPLFQYVLHITDYRIKRIGASGAVFWRKLDAFRHEVVIIKFVCRIYQLDFNRFRRFQSSHRILKMKNWFHVSFLSCFSFRVCVFWWPYQPEGFH